MIIIIINAFTSLLWRRVRDHFYGWHWVKDRVGYEFGLNWQNFLFHRKWNLFVKVQISAELNFPNLHISLENLREEMWGEQVEVVSCDMREWVAPEKADIIVSELLGSFGDNELSPECLDGAQRFLKGEYFWTYLSMLLRSNQPFALQCCCCCRLNAIFQHTIVYTWWPVLIVEEETRKSPERTTTHEKILASFPTYPNSPNLRIEPTQIEVRCQWSVMESTLDNLATPGPCIAMYLVLVQYISPCITVLTLSFKFEQPC